MGKHTGKVAAGALLAGALGFVAGILTAPKSGKETRQDIKKAATTAKTEAEKKLKTLHSQLGATLEKAQAKAGTMKGKAATELNAAIKKAGNAKEKAREVLSALHEGDADDPELKKAITDAKTALKHLETFIKA